MNKETETTLPAYQDISTVLVRAHALTTSSECHGLLCGLMCTEKVLKVDASSWAQSCCTAMAEDQPVDERDINLLKDLFQTTRDKLQNVEFDFQLLVPEDDTDLSLRAAELGHWCKGFIQGITLAGITTDSIDDEEIVDVINSFQEIAEIDYDEVTFSKEDEDAYEEVYEYVRLSTLTMYMVFTDSKAMPSSDSETLH